jgi:hypothetical protein
MSLTGKAVARIVSGEHAEADGVLTEAIGLVSEEGKVGRNPIGRNTNLTPLQESTNAEALANKVPIAFTIAKSAQGEALQTSLSQLRAVAPDHPLLRDLQEKEALFDEALQSHKEALSAAA